MSENGHQESLPPPVLGTTANLPVRPRFCTQCGTARRPRLAYCVTCGQRVRGGTLPTGSSAPTVGGQWALRSPAPQHLRWVGVVGDGRTSGGVRLLTGHGDRAVRAGAAAEQEFGPLSWTSRPPHAWWPPVTAVSASGRWVFIHEECAYPIQFTASRADGTGGGATFIASWQGRSIHLPDGRQYCWETRGTDPYIGSVGGPDPEPLLRVELDAAAGTVLLMGAAGPDHDLLVLFGLYLLLVQQWAVNRPPARAPRPQGRWVVPGAA